jgi:hypothetical protein
MTKIGVICNFLFWVQILVTKKKKKGGGRQVRTTLKIFLAFLPQHIYTPTSLSMTGITKKAASAKGQRQPDSAVFVSKPVDRYSETSDSEWVDDGEDERDERDSEDEEESCKEMASLYSVFLPRHLRPKITEFHNERPVCICVAQPRSRRLTMALYGCLSARYCHRLLILICTDIP